MNNAPRTASGASGAGERGIALVLALLLVLALAGLSATVVITTGADGDVARNARWAAVADARARAGLEIAKALLAEHARRDDDFSRALPPARNSVSVAPGAAWGAGRPADGAACGNPSAAGCRDYEFFRDETMAGTLSRTYVGRVLRDVSGRGMLFDARAPAGGWSPDLDGDGRPESPGATVWIRRPVVGAGDAPGDDRAILTAEARHPPPESPDAPHAVVRWEMTLRLALRPGGGEADSPGYADDLTNWGQGSGGGVRRIR